MDVRSSSSSTRGCSVLLPPHDWAKGSLVHPSSSSARISFTRVFDFPNQPRLLLCTVPGCNSAWTRSFSNAVLAAMSNSTAPTTYPINIDMRDLGSVAPLMVALEAMPADRVYAIACAAESEWSRVAIVRNPFMRLLSKFMDKIVHHPNEGSPPPYHHEDGQHFGKFVQRLEATGFETQFRGPEAEYVNGHFRSMSNFCGMRYIPYTYVRMEDLHAEMPRLATRLGVQGAPAVRAMLDQLRPYNACSDALRLRQHYDAATTARVRAYLAEDFRRFHYSTHLPSVESACSPHGHHSHHHTHSSSHDTHAHRQRLR